MPSWPSGTTGESATLNVVEHGEVIRFTIKHVNARVPVIAGTGANATDEAIHLTKVAHRAGASACLIVVPYYNRPPQEGLYQHFKAIADAVDVPQILYNVPARTACDMSNETVLRLAKISNIVGLKDATADVPRGIDLIEKLKTIRADFAVYSGEDYSSCDLMLGGGRGAISVTANVAPKLMHEMATAAIAGDTTTAKSLDAKLTGLHSALFVEPSPIPSKWALHKMKKIGPSIRLPLVTLSADGEDVVHSAMQMAGISV